MSAWPIAAGLLAFAVAIYSNAFGNPFFFDDLTGIVENPHVRHLWPLSEALGAPVQSVVAGRPVVALSLALNYAWNGLSPFGFHAVNLAIVWLTAVVMFAFLRRVFLLPAVPVWLQRMPTTIAASIAALWLAHPLNSEVVNYVVQRTESLMGLWYALTMYASLRAMTGGDRRWTILAIVVCALGMATKEAMVTAPVMALMFDAVFVAGSLRGVWQQRRSLYGGLATTWLILLVLNISGPRARSAGFASGITPWTYLLHQGGIILEYLRRVIWPHPLIADYGVTTPIAFSDAAPAVAIVAILLVATLIAFWKWPRPAFPALWFFVTLAPASSVVPIATEVGAERRMYLPLAGLVTLIVVGAAALFARRETQSQSTAGSRRSLIAIVAVLCAAAALTTYRRNSDYADPGHLWAGTVAARPTGRAHYNLGLTMKKRGDAAGALAEYQTAAAMGHWEAYYAIGFEDEHAGRIRDAIAAYREFIARAGDDFRVPQTYVALGRALQRDGQFADAESAYRRASSMAPNNTDAQIGLADLLLERDRYAEAIELYRRYVASVTTNAAAYGNMGKALIGLDRTGEAVDAFARAAALSPDPGTILNYGMALVSSGRVDEAIAQYRKSLATNPTHVPTLSALGVALALKGERTESVETFTRAYRLDPTNPQMRDDFRTVFGVEPRTPEGR